MGVRKERGTKKWEKGDRACGDEEEANKKTKSKKGRKKGSAPRAPETTKEWIQFRQEK